MARLTFNGVIKIDTPKAILFQDWFWEEPVWFPRSQVLIYRSPTNYEVEVKANGWICDKNEIKEPLDKAQIDERTTATG